MVDVCRSPIAMSTGEQRRQTSPAVSAGRGVSLPDGYEPLPHQVAGHLFTNGKLGMLRRCGDGTAVLKPVQRSPKGPRELQFYKELSASQCRDELQCLRPWVPQFHGVTDIVISDGIAERQQTFLLLEDLASTLPHASVIDLKIGRRCWDESASSAKINAELAKYPQQEHIGYRISAMRVFNRTKNEFKYYSKLYGLSLDECAVLDSLHAFFYDGVGQRADVIRNVLSQLQSLREVFLRQSAAHFYASSLLIVYDGGLPASPATVKVKMIDFAHTFLVAGSGEQSLDENYLFGLTHLIESLSKLLEH